MSRYFFTTSLFVFLLCLILGCSRVDNPISNPGEMARFESMPVWVTDTAPDGSILAGMGSLGLFNLRVDPVNLTGELSSLRTGALTDVLEVVDITNFLQLAPCTDCAKIKSVALDNDGNLVVSMGLKHPFGVGDPYKPITGRNRADLHVFNVEGIVISNASATSYSSLGQTTADFKLLSADGYTGYLDSSLDTFFPTTATIHPYVLHFDDYSAGNFSASNQMGFESVTTPPPSGNLVMAMGCDYDYQDYVFSITNPMNFIYAIGCSYAVSSASKSMRFTPEYRVPQHNKKAACEVGVEIIANGLAGGNTASSATLQISVVDINHGVAVGTALNEMLADSSVNQIQIEIPGVTSTPVSVNGGSPISGSGHDPSDPLIYEATVTNSAAGMNGVYSGLVKVLDSYSVGQNTSPLLNGMDGIKRVDPLANPLTGTFPISEFATYQFFEISVGTGEQLTVLVPNGGETWSVDTDEEITWIPAGVPGNVTIEYSKDNFMSDIHAIASSEVNDGSYLWQSIPNDPSDTVKVRIKSVSYPSIFDISDDYFSIKTIRLEFSDEGVLPEQKVGFHDISPAVCIETDSDIKMAYNSNQPVTYGGSAFSYACKSSDGLNWSNYVMFTSSWGGEWAYHGDSTKIWANNNGNSWRTLHLWSQTNLIWATPFAHTTELPYDGAIIHTYITRQPEILQDPDGYVYLMGDRNNTLQFKKSETPNALQGGPSGAIWQSFPVYNIGQGFFSRARSSELAPNDKMYFVYYENDSSNVIRLAYNNDSTGLTWNTSTIIYDGNTTSTTGAHDPGLDIDPDGNFHVTFGRVNGSNHQLCYVSSSDGVSWSSPVIITEQPGTINDNPVCFFQAGSTDILATIWVGAGEHIYISYSLDSGATWASPTQVDSLLPKNDMCDFVVSSDGVMHIVWSAFNGTDWDIHFRNAWLVMN